ncbi:MAG: GNAT family N-acetyltransferase [Erysipelotrichaceae bacterium]|nr:GNAT family N-acetyltransferase [Erysipelotrichaceae bacterium]
MIELISIDQKDDVLEKINALYQSSFPSIQRVPFEYLVMSSHQRDILGIYQDGRFCGFISMITFGDLTYVAYFAIDKTIQGRGLGSKVLSLIENYKPGNKIIFDVEAINEQAPNNLHRIRRKLFYLNNGFNETGIRYFWNNEEYETLVKNGSITKQEFDDFWHSISHN